MRRRTRATDLTDAELGLIDVLFDVVVPADCLRNGDFAERWNTTPHGLDDAALDRTLARFVDDGLVRRTVVRHRRHIELTPRGGDVWEAERLPDWTTYVDERWRPLRCLRERWLLRMIGIEASILRTAFEVGRDAGVFGPPVGRVRELRIASRPIVHWKPPESACALFAVVGSSATDATDEDQYERRRCWWTSVDEIVRRG